MTKQNLTAICNKLDKFLLSKQKHLNEFICKHNLAVPSMHKNRNFWYKQMLISIVSECAEILDHFNWKHWSQDFTFVEHCDYPLLNKTKDNYNDQIMFLIELVDIFHFLLSIQLLPNKDDKKPVFSAFLFNKDSVLDLTLEHKYFRNINPFIFLFEIMDECSSNIRYYSSLEVSKKENNRKIDHVTPVLDFSRFIYLLKEKYSFISIDNLYIIYINKMALNYKRQLEKYAMSTKTEDNYNIIEQISTDIDMYKSTIKSNQKDDLVQNIEDLYNFLLLIYNREIKKLEI